MKNHFQFKQFSIYQDKTAMKVCTDACLFGAYISPPPTGFILDIGTGTGVLSLMLAQRTAAQIEAIEIEQNAFEQAQQNVKNSIFENQINIFHQKLQDFIPTKKYDFIVTNPPFFSHNSTSPKKERNLAMHTDSLSFDDILVFTKQYLEYNGIFWILLPEYESNIFKEKAIQYNLSLKKQVNVYQTNDKPIFRTLLNFEKKEKMTEFTEENFYIYNQKIEYSQEFIALLKDYYIIF
ncbi:MAG: methyltransferase domain-containing protein [Bacteroidetes bacterium]|nr:MAG: methyltransferase domain-containing protein [Bacteroidota bacterium]TAG88733.1 MAG: methyltransferase domain-containing protein [Bacteroidota bacterium]